MLHPCVDTRRRSRRRATGVRRVSRQPGSCRPARLPRVGQAERHRFLPERRRLHRSLPQVERVVSSRAEVGLDGITIRPADAVNFALAGAVVRPALGKAYARARLLAFAAGTGLSQLGGFRLTGEAEIFLVNRGSRYTSETKVSLRLPSVFSLFGGLPPTGKTVLVADNDRGLELDELRARVPEANLGAIRMTDLSFEYKARGNPQFNCPRRWWKATVNVFLGGAGRVGSGSPRSRGATVSPSATARSRARAARWSSTRRCRGHSSSPGSSCEGGVRDRARPDGCRRQRNDQRRPAVGGLGRALDGLPVSSVAVQGGARRGEGNARTARRQGLHLSDDRGRRDVLHERRRAHDPLRQRVLRVLVPRVRRGRRLGPGPPPGDDDQRRRRRRDLAGTWHLRLPRLRRGVRRRSRVPAAGRGMGDEHRLRRLRRDRRRAPSWRRLQAGATRGRRSGSSTAARRATTGPTGPRTPSSSGRTRRTRAGRSQCGAASGQRTCV